MSLIDYLYQQMKFHVFSCIYLLTADPYAVIALPPVSVCWQILTKDGAATVQTRSSLSSLYRPTMTAGPAAPTLHCSLVAMKQPLCCAAYLPQLCSHYAALVSSTMKQPLCCAA
jgi:hypothetical protein